ncbi:MAG TPA: hypothetical protein VMW45_03725 [Dehalococcoidia bacterium]|nr:hypothetical protein [Dehalococcoidia bacterium]
MTIPIETWWLPRPSKSKYPGSFPLHFESKLFQLYPVFPYSRILQPFGGMALYGKRCDINPDTDPDYCCDAHNLPFPNNSEFDFVLLDPPYSDDYAAQLYRTGKLHKKKYVSEAVRVCKPGGYIAHYDIVLNPRPEGTGFDRIIVVLTRMYHKPRICCIYKKDR